MKEYGIDKVITDEDGRVLIFDSPVLYLDNNSEENLDYSSCKVVFQNPVPLINKNNERLGAATIIEDEGVVSARIFLDYHTPERLDIEIYNKSLYPALCGRMLSLEEDTIEEFRVTAVKLVPTNDFDSRIPSL